MIGFACKVIPDDIFGHADIYHTKSTTVTALSKLTSDEIFVKLDTMIEYNLKAIFNLVERVGQLEPQLRMVRLPGDILPLYTHPLTTDYYNDRTINILIDRELFKIGELARSSGTRLSFHPAQMILISSTNDDVTTRSIVELEYHALLATKMGYGKRFQDIKCNIHMNGGGHEYFVKNWNKLSEPLRNIITVENDEYVSDVQCCLSVKHLCPIVFDIHHQWISNGGWNHDFVRFAHYDIRTIEESWRGVTPVMHASTSQARLMASGQNRNQYSMPELRRHSSMMWNDKLNDVLKEYHDGGFDIMVEAKSKNVASRALFDYFNK